MIRDPSDGSVRETGVDQKVVIAHLKAESVDETKQLVASTTSGLPAGSTKPEELARLERSREFVRNYHAKKNA